MSAAAWQTLLDFWFGDVSGGMADEAKRQQWFSPSADFDHQCTQRFAGLLEQAAGGELASWLDSAHGRLAYIILTDQMPRNIHRGSAIAFTFDHLAMNAARDGVRLGHDRTLAWDERSFFYMPFEHSEDIFDQHIAVGLFALLRDQSPKELRNTTGNSLRFAQQHRDIILRFGRFPHRNAVLGRVSTAAEAAFIAQGDGFGQSV